MNTAGRAASDQTPRATAAILRQTPRASDVIGRLGGAEFAPIASSAAQPAHSAHLSRWRHKIAQLGAFALSVSVGRAAYDPRQPATIETLAARADGAMVANKQRRSLMSDEGQGQL